MPTKLEGALVARPLKKILIIGFPNQIVNLLYHAESGVQIFSSLTVYYIIFMHGVNDYG